ncbi:hypothetical protein SKAU_G00401260 [Synaphobranchus kaupii]|uniref:Uncharacterized protein n=1 Tax=Synaphobranchus kaupii TaxID=118154 RepID=A0A9Q1ICE0_SYNKA|nr:hypothetical protein SKAU_G00401260 [Synaphobranchus kaupii]
MRWDLAEKSVTLRNSTWALDTIAWCRMKTAYIVFPVGGRRLSGPDKEALCCPGGSHAGDEALGKRYRRSSHTVAAGCSWRGSSSEAPSR